MNIGEGSRSLPIEIAIIEVRERSRLGVGIGMDEFLKIPKSIKNGISH